MGTFDRPVTEWTEVDLLTLIADGAEESLQLEYKRCTALVDAQKPSDEIRNEFSKDVSAFANSAGGTIVYGIIEQKNKPIALDGGFDPTVIKKEWLEDLLHGRIHPNIDGLVIVPIPFSGTRQGKIAYVIRIPQSTTAHQAGDKKYYKRYNFKAQPMEDYEIRDVMNRLKFPRLVPRFAARHVESKERISEYALNVTVINQGVKAAQVYKIVLWIPRQLSSCVRGFQKQEIVEIDSALFGREWFKQSITRVNHMIFPDDEWSVSDDGGIQFVYKIDSSRYDRDEKRAPFLLWKTYADDMPPLSGQVFLSEVSRTD
jgi:hypothetical protein